MGSEESRERWSPIEKAHGLVAGDSQVLFRGKRDAVVLETFELIVEMSSSRNVQFFSGYPCPWMKSFR